MKVMYCVKHEVYFEGPLTISPHANCKPVSVEVDAELETLNLVAGVGKALASLMKMFTERLK